ncbi:MAG TPA: PIN domain-containing protein [Agitococcus sp.]|nr:PIN domain-containing protein [Agitococcus sp.]HNC86746.1 PIN domain-containing protein [Agitococcus sp.]
MSNFIAVYDANVLYPAPLRDLLMRLALEDMYRAKWTNLIHDEWIRGVLRQRPELALELQRTRTLMDAHVRDSLVEEYEYLIPALDLPDADDRHVLAAAIHCHASVIVTFNLKDFPADKLANYNIEAQHPDDFIVDLIDLNLAKVLGAVAKQRKALKNPPKSADELLDILLQQQLPQTVELLRPYTLLL